MSGTLSLRGVSKEFPTRSGPRLVLDDVSFDVAAGEFVCLVGASGSGKSTLLSIVAGLLPATSGSVSLGGAAVEGPGQERGLVFQSDSLFPWRTVEQNIAFSLELLPIPKRERAERVSWYLRELRLEQLRHSLPRQLSGGQRQRVAIARALACEPEVLLLDEPFGALDVQIKEDMQVFLRQVWRDTATRVLMVTHDVEEAAFLAQRVLVLASDPGRIADEIAVTLPEDRDLSVKRTADFLVLRNRIEDKVREQHRRHLAAPLPLPLPRG